MWPDPEVFGQCGWRQLHPAFGKVVLTQELSRPRQRRGARSCTGRAAPCPEASPMVSFTCPSYSDVSSSTVAPVSFHSSVQVVPGWALLNFKESISSLDQFSKIFFPAHVQIPPLSPDLQVAVSHRCGFPASVFINKLHFLIAE